MDYDRRVVATKKTWKDAKGGLRMLAELPDDLVTHVASFGRLSAWIWLGKVDVRWAAACKIQRAWREHRMFGRFVMGAVVRVCSRDECTGVAARMVGRTRRGKDSATWTARLLRPGFRHYVYIRQQNDPTYSVAERIDETRFVKSFFHFFM